MMKIVFVFILLITINVNKAAVQDLSGSYNFVNCSCTVLRCLEPSHYRIDQTLHGNFTIYYRSNILAALGTVTSINNGQQAQLSIQWLPGMDFDTKCTGIWVPTKRSIDLKCGDQYRYCTGQFQCRDNSGACAKNSTTAFTIQYINHFWKIMVTTIFLFLFKKMN